MVDKTPDRSTQYFIKIVHNTLVKKIEYLEYFKSKTI